MTEPSPQADDAEAVIDRIWQALDSSDNPNISTRTPDMRCSVLVRWNERRTQVQPIRTGMDGSLQPPRSIVRRQVPPTPKGGY